MSLEQEYRGRSLSDWVKTLVDWTQGNGEGKGAEKRLQFLEDNRVSETEIEHAVDKVIRKNHGTFDKDWNRWVNTGLLLVTTVGVLYGIIFGG